MGTHPSQEPPDLKQFSYVERYCGQDVFFPPVGGYAQVNDNTGEFSPPTLSGCQGLNSGSQVSTLLLPIGIYKNKRGGEEMAQ